MKKQNSSNKSLSNGPVILVGMPRSGSTLLTKLLNQSPDLFVINDFYIIQQAEGAGYLKGSLDVAQSRNMAEQIVKGIRSRIERQGPTGIESGFKMTLKEEQGLNAYAKAIASELGQSWHQILEKIMTKSGQILKKNVWGYNTPQDYLHLDLLFDAFPKARIIFLMRDPRDMLRSYKNVVDNGYHNPNRYHPILQSLAWRTATRRYFDAKKKDKKVLLVRYEDLTGKTNETLQTIANFCDITMPELNLSNFGSNSSYSMAKTKAKLLGESETWICEKIAKREMLLLNYAQSSSKLRIKDTGSLSIFSLRAGSFYMRKLLSSRDMRKRIKNAIFVTVQIK